MNQSERETLANLLPNAKYSSAFVISRGNLPNELLADIQTDNCIKVLVAGQRGMGKTTELRRLEDLLTGSPDHYPIFLQFGAEEKIDDVSLIYTMAQALISASGLKPKKGSAIDKWFAKEEVVSSYSESKSGEAGLNASLYVVRAGGSIKSSRDLKRSSTETVVKQKRDLVQAFNEVVSEANAVMKRQAVFIVDDIDKIQDADSVETTFISSAQLLGDLDAPCVFTVPYTYATSSLIRIASLPYQNIHRVPAIGIVDERGALVTEQLDFLVELLKKRIKIEIFSDQQLSRIGEYSGGVIVDALRLARGVAKHKILYPDETIEGLIEIEMQKLVDEYRYQLDAPILWQKIKKFCTTNDTQMFLIDELTIDMLCKMIVIEYRHQKIWYNIHPAVRKLYEQNKDYLDTHLPPS